MAHLRPLLRFIPCIAKSSYAADSYEQSTARGGRRTGGMKMDTFRNRTTVEGGGGQRDVDLIYNDLKRDEDGDSQTHILEEGGRGEEGSNGRGIKAVTEVTVTGDERDSDGAGYEPAPPLPLSAPGLGRKVWREE